MVRERTGYLPSYAEAKKMKLSTLHAHGFFVYFPTLYLTTIYSNGSILKNIFCPYGRHIRHQSILVKTIYKVRSTYLMTYHWKRISSLDHQLQIVYDFPNVVVGDFRAPPSSDSIGPID